MQKEDSRIEHFKPESSKLKLTQFWNDVNNDLELQARYIFHIFIFVYKWKLWNLPFIQGGGIYKNITQNQHWTLQPFSDFYAIKKEIFHKKNNEILTLTQWCFQFMPYLFLFFDPILD